MEEDDKPKLKSPCGIVVVDTLISSKEAQRFISDIRAVSDKPIEIQTTDQEA